MRCIAGTPHDCYKGGLQKTTAALRLADVQILNHKSELQEPPKSFDSGTPTTAITKTTVHMVLPRFLAAAWALALPSNSQLGISMLQWRVSLPDKHITIRCAYLAGAEWRCSLSLRMKVWFEGVGPAPRHVSPEGFLQYEFEKLLHVP